MPTPLSSMGASMSFVVRATPSDAVLGVRNDTLIVTTTLPPGAGSRFAIQLPAARVRPTDVTPAGTLARPATESLAG